MQIDKYVIIPNHIHLLVKITERINPFPTKKYDISNVIGKYKAAVTRSVGNAFMHSAKTKIWQRSFHGHIIRGEKII
ncbi:MAG: transposase [Clostridia bacterium]|nr:transposase [Clostridia bacterium]